MKSRKSIITIILILLVLVQDVLLSIGIVRYIEKREETERRGTMPYFTDKGLTMSEMYFMVRYFGVEDDPYSLYYEEEHWPDYSYYTMEPTERTEKVVSLINYHLFLNPSLSNPQVLEMATEYGFSKDNWITVEWVMENPKAAVAIYNELGYEGWHLRLIRAGYEVGDYHMFDESWGEETVE